MIDNPDHRAAGRAVVVEADDQSVPTEVVIAERVSSDGKTFDRLPFALTRSACAHARCPATAAISWTPRMHPAVCVAARPAYAPRCPPGQLDSEPGGG